MPFVTIKQAKTRDDRDFRLELDFKRGDDLVNVVNANKDKYESVAHVMLGGRIVEMLEEAYRLTNTIDEAWYENPDLTVYENAQNGCRSTSVGDIISIDGWGEYVVDGFGFKPLEVA